MPFGDAVATDNSLSAGGADGRHHFFGWIVGTGFTADRRADVVDDHAGAMAGHLQCNFAANASARASDNDNLALHHLLRHSVSSSLSIGRCGAWPRAS
ncbi:hypothetical protein D3C81_1877290 [compost metagenome]